MLRRTGVHSLGSLAPMSLRWFWPASTRPRSETPVCGFAAKCFSESSPPQRASVASGALRRRRNAAATALADRRIEETIPEWPSTSAMHRSSYSCT